MMLLRVTALVLLACGLWDCATASAGSEGAVDCCLATSSARIPPRLVKSYKVQTAGEGCRVDATLFITKRNKKLCAPPADKTKWVQHVIKKLNRKSAAGCRRGKNQKPRGKNCGNSRH
ncbi:C-C motif chemokine 19-like [Sardina pilchardus]|uniref:C-C motif chemokine 19-like n=1 Tax=Sardina pilchardus TaxID=27697 RepID=UPI002E0D0E65